MSKVAYQLLQERALACAQSLPSPLFYDNHALLLRRSEEALRTHDLIRKCRAHLDESQLECAHGVCHCEAVARDAGVIVLIESREQGLSESDSGNSCS